MHFYYLASFIRDNNQLLYKFGKSTKRDPKSRLGSMKFLDEKVRLSKIFCYEKCNCRLTSENECVFEALMRSLNSKTMLSKNWTTDIVNMSLQDRT
jgi:hypothetical protein